MVGFNFQAIFFICILIEDCQSLLMNHFGVPAHSVQGGEAVLTCDYDLGREALYQVKWYKNGLEIFRYSPSSFKQKVAFARPGVTVDVDRSDAKEITLKDLTASSTGRYRCEVSTEAPSFATVSRFGDMAVVVVPKSEPKITGGRERYLPGDLVEVNCTSEESKPAADLTWYINDQMANPRHLIRYPIQNSSGLHTAILGLKFRVGEENNIPHYSQDSQVEGQKDFNYNPPTATVIEPGEMNLKCRATIGSFYGRSNEKSAEGPKQKRRAGEKSDSRFQFDSSAWFSTENSAFSLRQSSGISFYIILPTFFIFNI